MLEGLCSSYSFREIARQGSSCSRGLPAAGLLCTVVRQRIAQGVRQLKSERNPFISFFIAILNAIHNKYRNNFLLISRFNTAICFFLFVHNFQHEIKKSKIGIRFYSICLRNIVMFVNRILYSKRTWEFTHLINIFVSIIPAGSNAFQICLVAIMARYTLIETGLP